MEEGKKDNSKEFAEITAAMLDVYKKKNHDYGDSFSDMLSEEGLVVSRVILGVKYNRFKKLSGGEQALVSNEPIEDTLLDLANYAIMTLMWLRKTKREEFIKSHKKSL